MTEGNTGNGKSYLAGMEFLYLLTRAIVWDQKGKLEVRRRVATNIDLNESLYEEYREYIVKFKTLDELIELRDCDVLFDDMGWYVNARRWQQLDPQVTEWFRTHEHYGCDVYGNCQDLKDVDVSIRKLMKEAKYVVKIAGSRRPAKSKPKVKKVWGVLWIRQVAIDTAEKARDQREFTDHIGRIEFIRQKYCNVYDTLQKFEHQDVRRAKCFIRIADCGKEIHTHP